ncbi:MAG: DNA photolyase [Candidatus Schekmanbacteria bacterium]|nr:DNA photolyase [Candidatus Schekmanbacteria bacterium]
MSKLNLESTRGSALQPCPGICAGAVCCNLHVLEPVEGCPMSCTYCFLQAYRPEPSILATTDTDRVLDILERQAASQPRRLFRVGTGEMGDSVALDRRLGFAARAVPRVARMSNVLLELKTKTHRIDHLLGLDHGGRTVLSWSLNSDKIAREEELGAASIADRLAAAARAAAAGYLLGFHFDPVVDYAGCEGEYADTIHRIGAHVGADRIAWISIGTLRLDRKLPQRILERFPESKVACGEMVAGFDGKLRYPKPRRIALSRALTGAIRAALGSAPFVYLCMEAAEVWERALGWAPAANGDFDYEFAGSVLARFPYLLPAPPDRAQYVGPRMLRDDWDAAEPAPREANLASAEAGTPRPAARRL